MCWLNEGARGEVERGAGRPEGIERVREGNKGSG